MSIRGPYKQYYDVNSTKNTPKSTKSTKLYHSKLSKLMTNQESVNQPVKCLNALETVEMTVEEQQELSDQMSFIYESENEKGQSYESNIPVDNTSSKKRKYIVNTEEQNVTDSLAENVSNYDNINVGEIMLLFLNMSRRFSLPWTAVIAIFEILNYIFKKSLFPTTKYKLKKMMKVNTESIINHVTCSNCNNYLGETKDSNFSFICTCGKKIDASSVGAFFIEINAEDQLKQLFSDPTILNAFEERFHRNKINSNGLEDVYDGQIYKEFRSDENLLGNPWNFSYTFNTDGCKSADHSKITIWPIFMMLHEFPERMRNKFMPLLGLWVSKVEPDMNIFLKPFIKQANKLSSKGITWYKNGAPTISKFFPLACCVDSVARCAMLNMKKFNGLYGCTFCEHPTENVDNVRKYPMQKNVPRLRTDESIKKYMMEAHASASKDIMGVWGPSALINLHYFSITKGMVLDFMHACLLGVTELHMTILFENAKKKYYIGSPATTLMINRRLSSLKPPSCIGKVPRSITERNLWTASEWLTWLTLYSLICLQGILPQTYYEHWALFVAAINILLEDSILPEQIEKARILLIKFVVIFERLYGKQYMHYNVHLLLHLTSTVTNWGPLWANSTFPFENENRLLLQMKKNNYRIAQEIAHKLLMYQQLPILQCQNIISDKTRKFCTDLFSKKRLKYIEKIENCYVLGSGKEFSLNNTELQCLNKICDISKILQCKTYATIIYKDCRYTSYSALKSNKRNNTIFQTRNGNFGIIRKICKIKYDSDYTVIIFFNKIFNDNSFIVSNADVCVNHLQRCKFDINDDIDVLCYSMLYRPCILMQLDNDTFIGTLVKGVLGQLIN